MWISICGTVDMFGIGLEMGVLRRWASVENGSDRAVSGCLTDPCRFRSVGIARPKVLKHGRCLSRGSAGTVVGGSLGLSSALVRGTPSEAPPLSVQPEHHFPEVDRCRVERVRIDAQ